MAKIVLSAAGSAGDIYPIIALAGELRKRGHSPLMATQVEYREQVEAHGVGFHPLRPSQEDVENLLGVNTQELIRLTTNSKNGLEFAVKRLAMPFLKSSYADMYETCADADLVITHTSAFAARLAAEKHNIPWLSAVLAPFAFMSTYDPPRFIASPILAQVRKVLGPAFERAVLHYVKLVSLEWTSTYHRVRAELGLPKFHNPLFEGQFSPLGTLALFSKYFGEIQPDYPSATNITGFCYFDGGAEQPLDREIEHFLECGKPPLIFTIGSVLTHEPRHFFEEAARAITQSGERAIFLAGAYAPQARYLASNSILVSGAYVPHAKVFPRTAGIVHHGGIGTTAQALRSGRPQLLVPFSADQPDNAVRLERMGVARSVSIHQFTAKRAMTEFAQILSPSYVRNAREIGEKLALEDGPANAIAVIERTLAAKSSRRYG